MSNVKKVAVEAVKAQAETTKDEAIAIVEVNSLYTSTKAINEAIEKAVFAGSSLQNEYQRIACSVLKHLDTHKDIRLVRHFLDTMPKSLRKDSMSAFFDQYGAVSFDDKGVIHYNKERVCNLKAAIKMPWWKAKKEEVYRPFNLIAKLESVLKQAEKRLQEGVHAEQGDLLTPEQVEALRNVVVQLERTTPSEAIAA
jgi:hypothetical protein